MNSVTRLTRSTATLCLSGMLFMLGCGGDTIRVVPAAGFVYCDGQPLDRAEVTLVYESEQFPRGPKPVSRGVTDQSGHLVLRTLTPDKQVVDGAVPGIHRVCITTRILTEDESGRSRVERPELLGQGYTSGQKITVDIPPAGTSELRIEVSRQ